MYGSKIKLISLIQFFNDADKLDFEMEYLGNVRY